ncbi:hypothetical protein D9Q81_01515 [Candidatus Korarchaeum cryptofilum]|uniref:Uncharacterized protein n=1 Tax=Candidatus Korarchaeum cryptofilum TaxID=498846 RepID=A0A429G881_9CREN|nr:hypothetical protein [Candidatus Korarchaeum cryptofilum]RSN70020.1 hypothetical protein D9Q81_01515 [Candidatus Korarchaeum cryptofilum]
MRVEYPLVAILIVVIAAATYLLIGMPKHEERPKGSWNVTIAYPAGQSSGGIALSSYSITLTLSFFSGGKINNTNIAVGSLGTVKEGNVTIVLRISNETSIRIFSSNSTVVVQGKDQDGLFAATDRLILAIAGDYALDLDSSRNYLLVVRPSDGKSVGLQWLGGYSIQQVKRVPIYVHGGQVNLMQFLLGPFSP